MRHGGPIRRDPRPPNSYTTAWDTTGAERHYYSTRPWRARRRRRREVKAPASAGAATRLDQTDALVDQAARHGRFWVDRWTVVNHIALAPRPDRWRPP
jgi:hypothetical protein